MHPCKRRTLADIPEGRLWDRIETIEAHIRSKGEHSSRVIKHQFGFQKTRWLGLAKNRCKVHAMADGSADEPVSSASPMDQDKLTSRLACLNSSIQPQRQL